MAAASPFDEHLKSFEPHQYLTDEAAKLYLAALSHDKALPDEMIVVTNESERNALFQSFIARARLNPGTPLTLNYVWVPHAVKGAHSTAGQFHVDAEAKFHVYMYNSQGYRPVFNEHCLEVAHLLQSAEKMGLKKEDLTLYANRKKCQADGISCGIFSLEQIRLLQTVGKYLPHEDDANLFHYLARHNTLDKTLSSCVKLVEIPLYLSRSTQFLDKEADDAYWFTEGLLREIERHKEQKPHHRHEETGLQLGKKHPGDFETHVRKNIRKEDVEWTSDDGTHHKAFKDINARVIIKREHMRARVAHYIHSVPAAEIKAAMERHSFDGGFDFESYCKHIRNQKIQEDQKGRAALLFGDAAIPPDIDKIDIPEM